MPVVSSITVFVGHASRHPSDPQSSFVSHLSVVVLQKQGLSWTVTVPAAVKYLDGQYFKQEESSLSWRKQTWPGLQDSFLQEHEGKEVPVSKGWQDFEPSK